MSQQSLEDLLKAVSSPVELLRNSQIGPYAFPVVPQEFTNWRAEQRSWRETCALFDQSHHMTDLYIKGADTIKLLSDLGVNTFKNFKHNKAKQFVACSYDGYVIGDAILFYLAQDEAVLVGRPPALNWVQFHAETGDYDVSVERDERSFVNKGNRKSYRFQVQGPNALKVLEAATGNSVPEIKFFNMDEIVIAGCKVHALRHGMVGAPGFELFGPWADNEKVRTALLAAGKYFGLRQVGARTYPTSTLESGWIPSPLPAVYTGAKMKAFREWLPADWYEGMASLGGSYVAGNIEDYYLTPYDLGYGPFVKFDHDFIGREALEKLAQNQKRRKVTLAWNGEDVAKAMSTLFSDGDKTKYIDLPLANYSTLPYDKIVKDGKTIGLSTYTGYSTNEGTILSLSMIDVAYAEPGTEVTVVWGEPDGGSTKPTVEPHKQTEIRATVGPVPYAAVARTEYRPG
jgi:glycine cleavage system aminomethyltransferase T